MSRDQFTGKAMQRILTIISGVFLSAGVLGLLGMAIVRVKVLLQISRNLPVSERNDMLLAANTAVVILLMSALGLVGVLFSYFAVLYPKPHYHVVKYPLFTLAAIYGVGLALSFVFFVFVFP